MILTAVCWTGVFMGPTNSHCYQRHKRLKTSAFLHCILFFGALLIAANYLASFVICTFIELGVHSLFINGLLFIAAWAVLCFALTLFRKYHPLSWRVVFSFVFFFLAVNAGVLVFYMGFFSMVLVLSPTVLMLLLVFLPQSYLKKKKMVWVRRHQRLILFALAFLFFIPIVNQLYDHMLFSQFDFFSEDSRSTWSLKQNSTYEINAKGFRGPVEAAQKNQASIRLLFLGDSSTFGFGVKAEQAYPALVGKLIALKSVTDISALNAGVNGFSVDEMYHRYLEFRDLSPTHVFIMAGEHYRDLGRVKPDAGNSYNSIRGLQALYTFLFHNITRTEGELPKDKACERWAASLDKLQAAIKSDGGQPIFLVYPSPGVDPEILAAQAQLAKERKIQVIGFHEKFKGREEELFLFDQLHPNREGHFLIAASISDWLQTGVALAPKPSLF